jgi:hypothetical protein
MFQAGSGTYTFATLNPASKVASLSATEKATSRFGFSPSTLINASMQALENNKTLELAVLDWGAMVVPRTYIETKERGPLMGQETFRREMAGNITIVYLAGWLGTAAAHVYNKLPGFNAAGLTSKAFINLNHFTAFAGLTQQSLAEQGEALTQLTPKALRQKIATRFVESLQDEFIHTWPERHKQAFTELSAQGSEAKAAARKELIALLSNTKEGPHAGPYGIEHALSQSPLPEGLTAKAEQKALQKIRYQLTEVSLKAEPMLGQKLEEAALAMGLTEKVSFQGVHPLTKKALPLADRELKELLLQMKRFMEHGLDRSMADVARKHGHGFDFNLPLGQMTQSHTAQALTQQLDKVLVGKATHWANPATYFPKMGDSLLQAIEKQKLWCSGSALLLTTIAAVGATFFNAYRTKQKLHGSNVYPGDENYTLMQQAMQKTAATPAKNPVLEKGLNA